MNSSVTRKFRKAFSELTQEEIYDACLSEIKNSDAVVAVVAKNCPGIAVEVGMARAVGKKIYTFIPAQLITPLTK